MDRRAAEVAEEAATTNWSSLNSAPATAEDAAGNWTSLGSASAAEEAAANCNASILSMNTVTTTSILQVGKKVMRLSAVEETVNAATLMDWT